MLVLAGLQSGINFIQQRYILLIIMVIYGKKTEVDLKGRPIIHFKH